jgi:hypothetical protein
MCEDLFANCELLPACPGRAGDAGPREGRVEVLALSALVHAAPLWVGVAGVFPYKVCALT